MCGQSLGKYLVVFNCNLSLLFWILDYPILGISVGRWGGQPLALMAGTACVWHMADWRGLGSTVAGRAAYQAWNTGKGIKSRAAD